MAAVRTISPRQHLPSVPLRAHGDYPMASSAVHASSRMRRLFSSAFSPRFGGAFLVFGKCLFIFTIRQSRESWQSEGGHLRKESFRFRFYHVKMFSLSVSEPQGFNSCRSESFLLWFVYRSRRQRISGREISAYLHKGTDSSKRHVREDARRITASAERAL